MKRYSTRLDRATMATLPLNFGEQARCDGISRELATSDWSAIKKRKSDLMLAAVGINTCAKGISLRLKDFGKYLHDKGASSVKEIFSDTMRIEGDRIVRKEALEVLRNNLEGYKEMEYAKHMEKNGWKKEKNRHGQRIPPRAFRMAQDAISHVDALLKLHEFLELLDEGRTYAYGIAVNKSLRGEGMVNSLLKCYTAQLIQ